MGQNHESTEKRRGSTQEDRTKTNRYYARPDEDFAVNSDTATTCATNLKRNAVEFMVWKKHLVKNYQKVESDKLSSDNVLFIECSMRQNKRKSSRVIHDICHRKLETTTLEQLISVTKEQRYCLCCVAILDCSTWSTPTRSLRKTKSEMIACAHACQLS